MGKSHYAVIAKFQYYWAVVNSFKYISTLNGHLGHYLLKKNLLLYETRKKHEVLNNK